jgi:hypothetical protein
LAARKERVAVLITAESIIAGFMIAYGAINGQLLVQWSRYGGSYMTTTYVAGIVIYTIVLTCFVSIALLFNSLRTENTNRTEDDLRGRYNAGYDLFLMAILGSAVFVVTSGYSIYHLAVSSDYMPISIPVRPLADVLFGAFLVYAGFLSVLLFLSWRGNLRCLARNPHLLLKILVPIAVALAASAYLSSFLTFPDAVQYCLMVLASTKVEPRQFGLATLTSVVGLTDSEYPNT